MLFSHKKGQCSLAHAQTLLLTGASCAERRIFHPIQFSLNDNGPEHVLFCQTPIMVAWAFGTVKLAITSNLNITHNRRTDTTFKKTCLQLELSSLRMLSNSNDKYGSQRYCDIVGRIHGRRKLSLLWPHWHGNVNRQISEVLWGPLLIAWT